MFAERLSVSPHRISSDTQVSENAGVFSAKLSEKPLLHQGNDERQVNVFS